MYFFRNGNWQPVKPCYHFCVWLKPVHLELSTAQMENVSIVNFCVMVKTIAVMDQMNLTAPAIVNFIWNHLVISLVSWKKNICYIKSGIFTGFLPFWLLFAIFWLHLGWYFWSDWMNLIAQQLSISFKMISRIPFSLPNLIFFRVFAILNTSGLFLPLLGIFCEFRFDLL